jgi:hypothetical protein
VITRLCEHWQAEREAFGQRDLSEVDYVDCWADGVRVSIRLGEQGRLCCLVIVGVRADGRKELVAVADGTRESTDDWAELLGGLRRRGMGAPVVMSAMGAGAVAGAARGFPRHREQRCWVQLTRNVLGALPRSVPAGARRALNEIILAEDRSHAERAIDVFAADDGVKWPKAVAKVTGEPSGCCAASTLRPSTGSTCAPQIRSRARSPRSGLGLESPRGRAPRTPGWRWCSSCSRPPRAAGGRSTVPTWSPWSEPARDSRPAS